MILTFKSPLISRGTPVTRWTSTELATEGLEEVEVAAMEEVVEVDT